MAQFAAILYEPLNARDQSRPGVAEYMNGFYEFGGKAAHAMRGGAGLQDVSTATTISKPSVDGDFVLSDGPYAETKEFLGGVYLFECEDLDAAIALSKQIPVTWADGARVEVRPCLVM